MITTIQLEKGITKEQYKKVVELLKSINISVKKDDTKMSKEEFFAMIDRARKSKKHEISREDMKKMLLGNE
ncbi:hypothetical protein [Capnocytophaga catalasegens]|uniref:Toxin-antitoxin system, antitoxin component, ribbon-helix-helix domain protein n=1 Tax=Capnocytophaga catalasegens TaxID=1004260 RepID=A0AAV5AQY1_9FLAO|nr:hypothetical protein [Capnocytophaga catalasegens]GIZ15208.1 hypothetical protein RCZ03_12080 [Capnocytophaga catalasegens]GJM49723.1 hypothetical protein RCZ15_06980 [Capnocytophaga catalasegens]GJM52788.1 hypothetical protein RCZ16_11050 [Capnocytophaga catalasegens]